MKKYMILYGSCRKTLDKTRVMCYNGRQADLSVVDQFDSFDKNKNPIVMQEAE